MESLKLKIFSYALIAALLLSGCSAGTGINADDSVAAESQGGLLSDGEAASSQKVAASTTASDKVKSEDLDASWDKNTATKITLNSGGIDVNGGGASVNGSIVTIGSAGTYVVSGTLTDGQIAVNAPENALVRLVLNGVELSNSTTSPVFCKQADKLLIILAEGSTNTITDSESYVFPNADTDEPNAAIFSNTDMTVNGTGALAVKANYNNGIGTKDDLIVVSGTLNVTARNDAVRGRDSVTVLDADLTLTADGDGIQSNNGTAEDKGWIELYGGTFNIIAAHDGVQAETWLTVEGGDFNIVSGGGSANAPERTAEVRGGGRPGGGMAGPQPGAGDRGQMPPTAGTSATDTVLVETMIMGMAADTTVASEDAASDSFKGLKAGTNLAITGGKFVIDSADDALHANGNVSVSGGELTISTGDDGMHADGDLVINGNSKIDILTSYEGVEGATVIISGGDVSVVASDDGINAAGGAGGSEGGAFGQDRFNSGSGKYCVRVEGGNVSITAGSDGIDSNGDLTISGGVIMLNMTNLQAAGGDGMLDKDGALSITGGTILGAGGNGIVTMGRDSSGDTSTQPTLQLYYTGTQTAGSPVELKDTAGNTVAAFKPERDFKCVIISVPELNEGGSYSVYTQGKKTLDLTLSGAVTSLQDTGEAVTRSMGGRGERPAAPANS